MKLILPNNIFSRILAAELPKDDIQIEYMPVAGIANILAKDENTAGLITPADLLNHPSFFVSKKTGISFDSEIGNTYMYFQPEKQNIQEIYLFGDISMLESIYSKIFFKELYDIDVQLHLANDFNFAKDKDVIVSGDLNLLNGKMENALSFSGELVDMLSLPFVNFIFASGSNDVIERINTITEGIEAKIYEGIEKNKYELKFPKNSVDYIKENFSSVIYNFDEQDVEAITQLVRLTYYYGIAKDIIDINFV